MSQSEDLLNKGDKKSNPYGELLNSCGVDELKLYFGEPFQINKYITIYQPTIGDVITYGEQAYFSMVNTITAIPSD